MRRTVGDVIFEIERYKILSEKFSVDFSESIKSTDDLLTCIKSKLNYADIIELKRLIDIQIETLKKVEVVEDGNDD